MKLTSKEKMKRVEIAFNLLEYAHMMEDLYEPKWTKNKLSNTKVFEDSI